MGNKCGSMCTEGNDIFEKKKKIQQSGIVKDTRDENEIMGNESI